jgi:hypothetical protein
VLAFVETSKGQTLQYVINDTFDKYDLLVVDDRQEAIILLEKILTEIDKVDTK